LRRVLPGRRPGDADERERRDPARPGRRRAATRPPARRGRRDLRRRRDRLVHRGAATDRRRPRGGEVAALPRMTRIVALVVLLAVAGGAAWWLTHRGSGWQRGTGNAACSKLAQAYPFKHPRLVAGTVVLACPGGG